MGAEIPINFCRFRFERETVFSALVLFIFLIAFYFTGYYLISNFYATRIAHYDSIGGYFSGFLIIDAVRASGMLDALNTLTPDRLLLSPLQGFFAFLFAHVLNHSAASFHLYNTLCLLWAFFGTFIFGRSIGISAQFSAVLCLLTLVPDGLYWWDLGVFDYRRDPGSLFLLTGTFFLMLSYFLGTWNKVLHRIVGVLLGISTALTLLSRDTAFGFVFGIIVLPAIVFWAMRCRTHGASDAFKTLSQDILHDAWNFGPDIEDALPVHQVAELFVSTWGGDAKWINEGAASHGAHEAGFLAVDSTRARKLLGWKPVWNVHEAIVRTANWYKASHTGADSATLLDRDINAYFEG